MEEFIFKKSLGQNFLIDQNIIAKIVSSITTNESDLIIEIGPGSGALTSHLKEKPGKLLCFEIDKRLKDNLMKYCDDSTNIIFEDFLNVDLNKIINKENFKNIFFVANLPYYITTPIVNKIIKSGISPKEMTFMVQKEVGERFIAKPNTKAYNSLSIFLQFYYDINIVCNVSKNCFKPKPKVDSVVLNFKSRKLNYYVNNEEIFLKLVKDSFQFKRKTLKNNLKLYDKELLNKAYEDLKLSENVRAEQLTIEDFIKISNYFC